MFGGMGCTYKVVLNKDGRKTKSGFHIIRIRVTLHRRSIYLPIDHKVLERDWSDKEGSWVKSSNAVSFELNSIIKNAIKELQQFELKQYLFNNVVTLQTISTFYNRKGNRNLFNDYAKSFVEGLRGKKLNTIKLYNTFLSHLNEFNPSISFNQLTESVIHDFAKWMERDKKLAGVTVHKYFKPFRLACKKAVKDGVMEKDPFINVSISEVVKPTRSKARVHLEVEEITKLKNCRIPLDRKDLIEVRKRWLMCFYAAFYYKDLIQLEWKQIHNSEHGYCILADRFKNENAYISPIHRFKHAIQIIEEQKGKDATLVFPEPLAESKFNKKLKDLAGIAGISKNLMNKTARHSSIQFWEAQGLGTQHVAKIAGHKKESTTALYFELSMRDINQQVSKFDFSRFDI
jgi:site-specific recombinase XerD